MPKLSEINLDPNKFKGKGLRPWTETKNIQPYSPAYQKERNKEDEPASENNDTNQLVSNQEAIGKQKVSKKEAIGKQSESNRKAKGKPISNQMVSNKEAISKQKVSKREAIGKQKVSNREAKGKPISNQMVNNWEAIGKQPNELNEDHITTIYKLTGLQKILFFYMVEKSELRGDFETGAISSDLLVQLTKTTAKTIKSILKRLSDKGLLLIDRAKSKPGKGGFRYYSIKKEFKLAAMEFKRIENIPKKIDEINGKQLVGQSVSNMTYSSNSSINTITTEEKNRLPLEWENIDLTPLQFIGFSNTNLKQLVKLNNPDVVQDSIYRFAYTLKHDPNVKKDFPNPLRVIMGVLRKGEGWSEPNYESPQDRALRELLERKKAEKEKRDKMMQELIELEFPNWEKQLTDKDRQRIIPPDVAKCGIRAAITQTLRAYFENEILPKRLEEESTST